ncbi:MAG: hypothetical protein AAF629_00460 [Chloroflexota bacterium]
MKLSLFLVITALVTVCSLSQYIRENAWPISQTDLNQPRIYAYRDWQSLGVQLERGDMVIINADGTWLYTPGEYHGPEGSSRYSAPSFYPLPHVPGGALIGRIGEKGEPFYVGKSSRFQAYTSGVLYLRIDDDMLSDNEGSVTVEVTVERESQN